MKSTPSILRQNLGVDVSKDSFQVVFSTIDIGQYVKVKASRSFANTLTGFKHLQQWIEAKKAAGMQVSILLEATDLRCL